MSVCILQLPILLGCLEQLGREWRPVHSWARRFARTFLFGAFHAVESCTISCAADKQLKTRNRLRELLICPRRACPAQFDACGASQRGDGSVRNCK